MARSKRSVEKEQFWRLVVEQQRQGGLNIRTFCRQKGISEPSFYAWRRELQNRDADLAADTDLAADADTTDGRLIPVEVVNSTDENNEQACRRDEKNLLLEICTPGGFTLRFDQQTTPETISRLLAVINRCPIPPEPPREGASSC